MSPLDVATCVHVLVCMYYSLDLLQSLDHEVQLLMEEQPSSRELIEDKQSEIIVCWEQLTQRADER